MNDPAHKHCRNELLDGMLVLRCQSGDSDALEHLVKRWQDRLWRHARRLTGDEDAAWDVLQETWLGVARRIQGLNDPDSFPAWIYQVVSNKCRDWIRRESRRRKVQDAFSEMRLMEAGNALDSAKQAASLKEALEQLASADRTILSLHYEEDFDLGEIAAILSIPVGTVKSRLYYARQRLIQMTKETKNERG